MNNWGVTSLLLVPPGQTLERPPSHFVREPRVKLPGFQTTHPLCTAYLPPSASREADLWEVCKGLRGTFGKSLPPEDVTGRGTRTYNAILPAPPCSGTAQSLGGWPDIPQLIAELSGRTCGWEVLTFCRNRAWVCSEFSNPWPLPASQRSGVNLSHLYLLRPWQFQKQRCVRIG